MAFDLLAYAKERKKETNSSTQQAPEAQGQFNLKDYALRKNAGNVAKSLSDRVNTWMQNHNNYIQNYQTRYSGRKFNYEDAYVKDSKDWLDTVNKQRLNFQAEADNILSYLDQYKGYLDSEYVSQIQKTLTDSLQQQKSISAVASQDNDWWSNFRDEQKYQTAGRYDGYQKKYSGKEYDDIQKAIEALDDGEEKEWLRIYQGDILKGNEDFLEFSKKGASIENPTFDDAQYNGVLFGLKWGNDDVGNIVTFSRDNWEAIANDMADENLHVVGNYLYHYMDENEVDVYNYLLAKEGKERAQEYLDSLEDQLNRRAGTGMAQNIMGIDNDILRVVTQGTFGLTAGLDQWASGTRQFFTDEQLPTSPTQYANAEIYNSLDGFGQNLYTATNVIGNMAPSILVSAVAGGLGVPLKLAQGAGALTMGVSAAGNAYADALDKGYEKGQARTYSTLVGAAEGGLQYLMGGIGKLGGVGTEKIMSKVAMIDNSLLRISAKLGVDLLGEVAEEELQNFLEPALRSIIFGEDYDMPTIDELLETAIVTAITTPILGGKDTIMEDLSESKYYKETYGGSQQELVGEALEIDPNNVYAQKLQGYLDKGKTLNGNQLNRLVQQNDTAITAQDMTTIQSAAESRLTELGETVDVSAVAAALTKQAAGQKLTKAEQQTISNSKYGQRVANEMNPENIKTGGYNSAWVEKLDTQRINVEEYSRLVEAAQLPQEISNITGEQTVTDIPKPAQTAQAEPVQEPAATIRENQTVEVQPETTAANDQQITGKLTGKESLQVASQYEVSADGKAELGGKAVVLNGFKKMEDGSIVVATADNQTAVPSEVKYPSKGHALVYEVYANLESTARNPVIAGMDVDTRSALAKAYDPASGVSAKAYVVGSNQAYWYGFEGITMDEKTISQNSLVRNITEEQRAFAYDLGKKAGKQAAATQDAGIQAAYEKAVEKLGGKKAAAAISKKNKGKVIYEDSLRKSGMTKKQRASAALAEHVAKATGADIHVYHGMNEHGKYDPETGEIWLNINANFKGSSMMAFTLAHELVHMAKQWSPAEFKAFADYLLEQYGKKGVSVEALIQEQMANAKRNGYTLDEHAAYEEVIADACQRMLLDSDALQKMAGYKEQNPSKWQQIVEAIRRFIGNIRKLFEGAEADSMEASIYKEFDEDAKQFLENLFVNMVMDAGEHMSTIRNAFGKGTVVEVNENGEFTLAKGEDSDGVKKFLYNDYTWERGGRDTLKAALEAEGYSKDDINAALTIMDGKHQLVKELAEQFPEQDRINQATVTTDLKDGHSVLSALVSNGDYPVNIDLLMVCKKRKAYQRVINRLCETGLIQQATVDALAIAEINKILGKYGFETACLGCFVESRRLRIQEWANTIVKEWNAEVKKRNPEAKAFGFGKGEGTLTPDEVMQLIGELESGGEKNDQGNLNLGQGSAVKRMGVLLDKVPSLRRTLSVEDLITPDGLTALRKFDSNLFSMVKSRYGSNSPKFVQEFNPYNHELAMYGKVPSEYKSLREYLYAIGGARMQSFSDFIVENWFDYCQIVADLSARKLPMHTYTKEIALAKLFGQTGIKINMSLIPDIDRSLGKEFAGLTRNEKGELELIWADKDRFKATGGESYMQSINFADAVALQNDPRYSSNVGTIAVGVSDKHILTMLDDARVRMIIPYHSSGMNPIFADLMGTSYYKDYTMFQNTTVKQLYNSKGEPASVKLEKAQNDKLVSGFQFNEVLQELGDARAAAQAYKDWCADASKHTITIKGETYTAELTPKFDSFSWHDNYYKLLEDFNTYDSISEEAAPQGDVQQIYPENFSQILTDELTAQEGHRQKQAENHAFDKAMGEIESYLLDHTKADTVFYAEQHGISLAAKDKKLGAADKQKLADLRKNMKMSMPKVDSKGNNLSAEQQEFFKDSVVRDAEGKLMVMYHGTANGGAFTVFDGDKLGNDTRTTQIGQGFYFTNVKKEAESYMKNVDIFGKVSKGRNPHLHQVYINITNPFDITVDKLDIEKIKAVYMDGTYDYFFNSWIPFYLDKKAVNGSVLTKAEVQAMSKAEKVSVYVDYLSRLGTKELLSNMVRAFPFGNQSDLLTSMKKQLGYDGLVEEFKPGQFQYVAFSSEQVKSVDNKNPTDHKDIRYSMPKVNSPYSYDSLISKPDMMVTTVGENVPKNRADLVYMAKQNAAMVGKIDPKSGSVSVYVKDIGRDVGIGRDGLKHSLDGGRISVNAPILVKAGEIISNSIRINELTPREDRIDESYVLIGAARNADNDLYIVSSVVNRFTHKLVSLDVLYAINAKKEPAALLPLSAGSPALGTDSTISIAKLLDYVNQYFPDVLPEEVLKHYGHDSRPDGKLGEDALYKNPNTHGMSSRQLLADAFDELVQTPEERELMDQYQHNITKVEEVQERLKKLRGEISQLTKANGDKNKIADLSKTATGLADLIDRYDRKLLELEASKPLKDVLRRAQSAAYQEAKTRHEKTMKEYRQQVSERFDRGVEGRRKTEMRHKIQNVVKELNDLLLNESKKRHVPDTLKKSVADALALVNMDTVEAEERAAKYAALIAKEQAKAEPDQAKIDAYTATMENILRQGDKMGQRLKDLRDAYEEIQESDDPDIANAYDPVIAGAIKELTQTIGNTSIRNMTLDQLSDVYDVYRMVLIRVRDANKALLENIKESIGMLASATIGEVRKAGGEHTHRAAILDPAKKFLWNNLKPVYAMEMIGSPTLIKVFNNVRAGEDTWAKDVTEAREFYLDKSKKYGYDSWDFKKKFSFESASGLKFELTLEQILSLYAYSKRDQAHDHLRLGGFVFDSNIETYKDDNKVIKYKVNTADAHQITPEILGEITGKLTKEQMRFVDEMQEYLSTVMGAKGNEVTSKMYGVKLFKEKFYFPLKSAKQFMFEQNEVSGEVKIKNSGFTNKVVAKANNPVILSNFMDVWAGHVNDMSMYHAFTLPLEDFNRVFNYNSPKQEGQPPVSVKGTIQSAYSPAAVNYVKTLITDLNGGARTDPATGPVKWLMGQFKYHAVYASLSVVIQQPSAVARAAALVDTKYFIGPKIDHKTHKKLWDEVKQYAPVAIIKEMGYFDTNMGKSTQDFIQGKEYDGFKDKMKALVKDGDYRDEVLSKAPALADEIAWCGIWEAVKRETKAKNPGVDANSEAFLQMVGERFTEVITKTQVYDSVLSRSGNMRSKDNIMKMATAFMAEPTTSINMVADALLKGKRGNWKYARKAIGAVIASQLLNAILVSFVYAGRDDDEDKTYLEKYIGSVTGAFWDSLNPAGYIPFIKDIMSIVKGYDVERMDMAIISDLWKAWENLSKDNVSAYRKVEGFAGSIAQFFRLPLKNIMRDVRGIYQTIESFVNGQQTTASGIGYAIKGAVTGKDVSDRQQLYETIIGGDQAHIARVKSRFKDQTAINTAIRTALRENDPRIHDAAIAWNANDLDEYMRIAKEIIAEKHFVQDDVVMAIRTEASALEPDEGTSGTSKAKGLFTEEKFAEAVTQRNAAMANAIKADIIKTAMLNGKTRDEAEKSFAETAKDKLKEQFLAGNLNENEAVNALTTYCGRERDAAMADVQYWAFKQKYPETHADDQWFDTYYAKVADSGLDIEVYMEYRNAVSTITGEDKKERRMEVIHSLPITKEQKDALYLAENWAESKLYEAPWH